MASNSFSGGFARDATGAMVLSDPRSPFSAAAAGSGRTFDRDRQIRSAAVTVGGSIASAQAYRVDNVLSIPVYDGHGGWVVNMPAISGGGIVNPSGQQDAKVLVHGMGKPVLVDSTEDWIQTIVNVNQAPLAHGNYTVSVMHYGNVIQMRYWTRAGGQFRWRVDGEYVTSLAPVSVGGGSAYVTQSLDFTADGPKWRLVQMENYHGNHFSRLNIGATDMIALPPPIMTPSLYCLGDSFFDGSYGEQKGFEDMVHILAARLGTENVTVDALGGTGYWKTNGAFANYATRIGDNLDALGFAPDIIVIGGSINDQGFGAQLLQDQATSVLATLKQKAPKAKVFAFLFGEKFTQIGQLTNPIAGVKAACAAAGVPVLDLSLELTGTGDVVAPASSGTRDVMLTSAADPHPTAVAHQLYAARMAQFIQANLAS